MKKPIAILLLTVHLFNLGGYSLIFRYLIRQSNTKFVKQLDRHAYNDADLVEISIPLHLPYSQNSSAFERIDGSVENNGIHYNLVKQRIHNDTLYIMCLPNEQKTQLAKGKTRYAEEVNDFSSNKKEKESPVKKTTPVEYSNDVAQYLLVPNNDTSAQCNSFPAAALIRTVLDMPDHPPKQPADLSCSLQSSASCAAAIYLS